MEIKPEVCIEYAGVYRPVNDIIGVRHMLKEETYSTKAKDKMKAWIICLQIKNHNHWVEEWHSIRESTDERWLALTKVFKTLEVWQKNES